MYNKYLYTAYTMDTQKLRIRVPLHMQHTIPQTHIDTKPINTVQALTQLLEKYRNNNIQKIQEISGNNNTTCRYSLCNVNCIRDKDKLIEVLPSKYKRKRYEFEDKKITYKVYPSPLFKKIRCSVCNSTSFYTDTVDNETIVTTPSCSIILSQNIPLQMLTQPTKMVYNNPFANKKSRYNR